VRIILLPQLSVFRTSGTTAALRTSVIITNYCWHIAYKECCNLVDCKRQDGHQLPSTVYQHGKFQTPDYCGLIKITRTKSRENPTVTALLFIISSFWTTASFHEKFYVHCLKQSAIICNQWTSDLLPMGMSLMYRRKRRTCLGWLYRNWTLGNM